MLDNDYTINSKPVGTTGWIGPLDRGNPHGRQSRPPPAEVRGRPPMPGGLQAHQTPPGCSGDGWGYVGPAFTWKVNHISFLKLCWTARIYERFGKYIGDIITHWFWFDIRCNLVVRKFLLILNKIDFVLSQIKSS